MNRDDFYILKNNIIYFDNGATTLKPYILGNVISDYYNNYSANAHRGDYDISVKVNLMYENSRKTIQKFINAKSDEQIVFTSNTTDSLNKIIFGYYKNYLKKGDEVLITKAEHASLVLPWFELQKELGIVVKYIELDNEHGVTLDNVIKSITNNTKVISIAHITNVVGDIRPVKEIIKYAHASGVDVLIDGAQSIPHMLTNVKDLDMDFLTFSAHKMCGPTGVGVIYIKEDKLNKIKPIIVGGGMNASFEFDGTYEYNNMPYLLEAGTPNIAGVIGYGAIINYLTKIGMKNIENYEKELRKYAIGELKKVPNIILYNENSKSSIITFNIKDIFPQDLAIYLNKYNICIRAGSHCAKILKDELKIKNTCRMSLYFYNTKDEIDRFVEVLKNPKIIDEII